MVVRVSKIRVDYYELDCGGNRLEAFVYDNYIITIEPDGAIRKISYNKEFFSGCKTRHRRVKNINTQLQLFYHGSPCGEATVSRRGPSPAGRLIGEAPRMGARPDSGGGVTGGQWVAGKRGNAVPIP